MAQSSPADGRPVLLLGATGDLGGRVLRALRARGKLVRALVRPGSDASGIPKDGVEVVRGDMLDPASLGPAMANVSAVLSTAIGYSGRKKGDSLRTDFEGNRNLVDAAKRAGVPRFVFLSILACDKAEKVPHFWAKKVTEDYLEEQGVPFVALRPGAFLGAVSGRYGAWAKSGLEKGRVMGMTPQGIRMTYISPDEVARALALAVDLPDPKGQRIDLGSDRPLSGPELAELIGRLLGKPMQARTMGGGAGAMFRLASVFNPRMKDMLSMFRFFQTGQYIADTRRQAELYGPVPKVDDAARSMLEGYGFLPKAPSS
jgi:uncharacterized protein YbjT (DUF2867 family)